MRHALRVFSKYVSEVGGETNREIVSFRSCVRCEAVCERETMMFPSLGFATANSAPARGRGRARGRALWFGASLCETALSFECFCESVQRPW